MCLHCRERPYHPQSRLPVRFLSSPTVRVTAILLLSAASLHWTKLSPVAGFLVLFVWLAMPPIPSGSRRTTLRIGLVAAVLLCSAAFVRFVLHEAIPGVIAGGKAAATKQAISFARGVVQAQDHVRQNPAVDPDEDGIGSALWLHALAGQSPTRAGNLLQAPPLSLRKEQLIESNSGLLIQSGAYLFKICLPVVGGSFSSTPGAQVDDERAERRYLLFGWPQTFGPGGPEEALFIDEHERIHIFKTQTSEGTRFHGINQTPPCDPDAALQWPTWKDKQPRTSLPGDRSEAAGLR